jgi:RNA polymerase sigma-70 factor, ECF subfamily
VSLEQGGHSDEIAARWAAGAAGVGESPPSDADLLARVRARDERALMMLYDRYGGFVLTVALRIVGDRELAQEVLQDTFLRCWNGAAQYQAERGHVGAWLTGIARNRAIDLLRSRQHQARLRERGAPSDGARAGRAEPRSADETELLILREVVGEALGALPRPQRQVVELAYYGGLTQSEIARTLGEPLGTVKTRTRAALDRLRIALRPYFTSDPPEAGN